MDLGMADALEKDLPITFAVVIDGSLLVVEVPEKHRPNMDGAFFEDNMIKGVPEGLAPGLYRGLMDYKFWEGYSEGFPAAGESDWEYHVKSYEKVA